MAKTPHFIPEYETVASDDKTTTSYLHAFLAEGPYGTAEQRYAFTQQLAFAADTISDPPTGYASRYTLACHWGEEGNSQYSLAAQLYGWAAVVKQNTGQKIAIFDSANPEGDLFDSLGLLNEGVGFTIGRVATGKDLGHSFGRSARTAQLAAKTGLPQAKHVGVSVLLPLKPLAHICTMDGFVLEPNIYDKHEPVDLQPVYEAVVPVVREGVLSLDAYRKRTVTFSRRIVVGTTAVNKLLLDLGEATDDKLTQTNLEKLVA